MATDPRFDDDNDMTNERPFETTTRTLVNENDATTTNKLNVTFRTEEDDEGVISDDTTSRKSKFSEKRNRKIIRWLCVYIAALAVTAGGVLGGVCGGLQLCTIPSKENDKNYDYPRVKNDDTSEEEEEDLFRGPKQAFGSSFELQTAVQLYAEYDRTSVRKYGKTILEWDVSNVQDFSYLFDSRRIQNDELLGDEDFQFWNMSKATTLEGMFLGQKKFRGNGLEHWDVSHVTSMRSTFAGCLRFSGDLSTWDTRNVKDLSFVLAASTGFLGNLSAWNTSSVTSMEYAFYGLTYFNSDLSHWDVQNVKNFSAMFHDCKTFQCDDLTRWNTSNALDMSEMFEQAARFNGNISTWDVRNVKTLRSFLDHAESFRGDLSQWQTDSCTDLSYAFRGARYFNSNLGNWNVQNVETLESTFMDARGFTGEGLERWNTSSVRTLVSTFDLSGIGDVDLSGWDTRNVEDFSFAFYGTGVNSDLSLWETSSGTSFQSMFNEAHRFNSPLYWDVSAAIDVTEMFEQATSFVGHGLEGWDVSNVQTFYGMFDRSAFNTDISSWNVRNGQDFDSMFAETVFNYDISSWDVSNAVRMNEMFYNSSFRRNLCAWDAKVVSLDKVDVSNMFRNSSCVITSDPQLGGPWCTGCSR